MRLRILAGAGALALAAGLIAPRAALADGEAGLVIQDGDQVRTYCVAFSGESIGGDQLLTAAGVAYGQFGGSGGSVLCSIQQVGCFSPGSFNDCFCECQGGSCTYWAFFTQKYGETWKYSALAFNATRARDGDLHGWKWGKGSLQNAPVPASATFESVCGHAPRGGQAPATVQPATVAVTSVSTRIVATLAAATSGPTEEPSTAAVTVAAAAAATATPGDPTILRNTATPAAPATGEAAGGEGEDGGQGRGVIGFSAVVAGLGVAIAGALVWRRRHGR